MPHVEPIVGHYLNVDVEGLAYRLYFEEAGKGVPLLCLHTAGADSRQFRHLLNDETVTKRFRVVAFDMPYHGRSNPPDRWWLRKYRLETATYLRAFRKVRRRWRRYRRDDQLSALGPVPALRKLKFHTAHRLR